MLYNLAAYAGYTEINIAPPDVPGNVLMARLRVDYDSPWKEVLERFFEEFIFFCFPAIHAEIDWSQPPVFLDKELQQSLRRAKITRRAVDKLVKVWLRDGHETWLLIHIEVQNQVDQDFPKRMYIYSYRIFDYHNREVVSLAILGDNDRSWRPQSFGYQRWGCQVNMRFPIVKLLDFEERWSELATSDNPVAMVIMAHLKTMTTQRNIQDRLRWKIELVKALYQHGHQREFVWEIFRFIDWIMILPEKYEQRFEQAIKEYEEGEPMPYVTTIERRATKRGHQQGHEQGLEQGLEQGALLKAQENVLDVLRIRFETIPQSLVDQITGLTNLAHLSLLLRQAVLAPSLDEFERALTPQQNGRHPNGK